MISGWGTLDPGLNLAFFVGLMIPLTAISLAAIGYEWLRNPQSNLIFHASWFASGLSIPILLPLGYQLHFYYVWGLLVPLAMAGGLILSRAIKLSGVERAVPNHIPLSSCVAALIVISLTISSLGLGTFPAAAYINGEPVKVGELQTSGEKAQSLGVTNSSEITFVGPWGYDGSCKYWNCHNAITRVVIYADLLPKQRSMRPDEPHSPEFADTAQNATNCEVMAIYDRESRTVRTKPC
jgi:hypothetical protein